MKIICAFITILFLITTHCFSDAVDDIQKQNLCRIGIYNASFNPTDGDPLGLEQLSEKTTIINNSLIKNVDKNRIATKQEKRTMLQAVFATEIIYGEARPSYLADVSEGNVICGHCYVLEYSALLARDFLKSNLSFSDVDASKYKKLFSYCSLDKAQLFDWFLEMLEQHRPGKLLRGQDVTIQAQNRAKHSDSSLSVLQNSRPSLTYPVLNPTNCADYHNYVACFDCGARTISAVFGYAETAYDSLRDARWPANANSITSDFFSMLHSNFCATELFKKLMSFEFQISAIKDNYFIHISSRKSFISFIRIQNGQVLKGSASLMAGCGVFKTFGKYSKLSVNKLRGASFFIGMPMLTENLTLLGTDTQKEFQDKFKLVFGESVMVLK